MASGSSRGGVRPTFNWRGELLEQDLLLFEAFVTNMGKTVSHVDCARAAIRRFRKGWEHKLTFESAINEQ